MAKQQNEESPYEYSDSYGNFNTDIKDVSTGNFLSKESFNSVVNWNCFHSVVNWNYQNIITIYQTDSPEIIAYKLLIKYNSLLGVGPNSVLKLLNTDTKKEVLEEAKKLSELKLTTSELLVNLACELRDELRDELKDPELLKFPETLANAFNELQEPELNELQEPELLGTEKGIIADSDTV